jgi:hypothetical protein
MCMHTYSNERYTSVAERTLSLCKSAASSALQDSLTVPHIGEKLECILQEDPTIAVMQGGQGGWVGDIINRPAITNVVQQIT